MKDSLSKLMIVNSLLARLGWCAQSHAMSAVYTHMWVGKLWSMCSIEAFLLCLEEMCIFGVQDVLLMLQGELNVGRPAAAAPQEFVSTVVLFLLKKLRNLSSVGFLRLTDG